MYHFFYDWYESSFVYTDIVEVSLMTALYFAFMQVSIERLLCVLLGSNYTRYMSTNVVKRTNIGCWMVACIPGLLMWVLGDDFVRMKSWYYIVCDLFIALLIAISYVVLIIVFKSKKARLNSLTSKLIRLVNQ